MSSFANNLFYNTFKTTMGCSSCCLCFCTVQEDALIIRVEALACVVIMSLLKTTVFAMHFCRYSLHTYSYTHVWSDRVELCRVAQGSVERVLVL